jgi:ATP-binding cassette subfamily C (CFTR/MRP) protein 4
VFIVTIRQLFNAPFMLLLFCVLLYVEVGVFALAGIGLILLMLFIILLIGKLLAWASNWKLKFSTMRNHEMTFVLAGMKSVKFNCWEEVVIEKIRNLKARENKFIFVLNGLRSFSEGLGNSIPSIAGFLTIVLYNVSNTENMSLERVFFVLSIFNTLITPLKQFFYCYSNMEITRVSLSRIQKLLSLPDFKDSPDDASIKVGEVSFNNCTMSYKEKRFHEGILDGFKKSAYSDKDKTNIEEGKRIA